MQIMFSGCFVTYYAVMVMFFGCFVTYCAEMQIMFFVVLWHVMQKCCFLVVLWHTMQKCRLCFLIVSLLTVQRCKSCFLTVFRSPKPVWGQSSPIGRGLAPHGEGSTYCCSCGGRHKTDSADATWQLGEHSTSFSDACRCKATPWQVCTTPVSLTVMLARCRLSISHPWKHFKILSAVKRLLDKCVQHRSCWL